MPIILRAGLRSNFEVSAAALMPLQARNVFMTSSYVIKQKGKTAPILVVIVHFHLLKKYLLHKQGKTLANIGFGFKNYPVKTT